MIIHENLGLSYDDVLLYPQKGVVKTRADVDLSTRLTRGLWIDLPIVSAPMTSVTDGKFARAMYLEGGRGIIHRNQTPEQQCQEFLKAWVKGASPLPLALNREVALALGVNEGFHRLEYLYERGATLFCIDIAHGHCKAMETYVKGIDAKIRGDIQLIAGNVATREGVEFLADLGVDAIKVGIGPGAACTTRTVTGFGVPQLSAIMTAYDVLEDTTPIIADGGIKNSGDIAKALAAGASTVMLGRLLAGADEAPHPGEYFGMASRRVNGHNAPEGAEGSIDRTGPLSKTLKKLEWGLKSAVSYGGATNLEEFRRYAEFVKVSPMTQTETGVRI